MLRFVEAVPVFVNLLRMWQPNEKKTSPEIYMENRQRRRKANRSSSSNDNTKNVYKTQRHTHNICMFDGLQNECDKCIHCGCHSRFYSEIRDIWTVWRSKTGPILTMCTQQRIKFLWPSVRATKRIKFPKSKTKRTKQIEIFIDCAEFCWSNPLFL